MILGIEFFINERFLPAGLSDAHEFSGICFFTNTDTAEIKLPHVSIRTSTV
jgi:hypothetical protein